VPYRVFWRDDASEELRNLQGLEQVWVRRAVGSFSHDRRLNGRPFRRAELSESVLLMLEAGDLALVYRIDEAERSVEIFAILRSV